MVDIRIRIISPHPLPLLRKCASTPSVQTINGDADLVNADFRDLQTIPMLIKMRPIYVLKDLNWGGGGSRGQESPIFLIFFLLLS